MWARLARYRPFTSYRKHYGFLIRIRPVAEGSKAGVRPPPPPPLPYLTSKRIYTSPSFTFKCRIVHKGPTSLVAIDIIIAVNEFSCSYAPPLYTEDQRMTVECADECPGRV